MSVTDSQVKSKAEELGSQNRSSSELDSWLTSNGATATQGAMAGREYNKALNARNSGNQSQSQPQQSRTLSPTSITQAMSYGQSSKSEMASQYKVDVGALTDPLTASSAIQSEILKQLERESQLHTDINEQMGLTGELSRAYRDTILDTVPLAATLGFDIKNITDMVTTLGEKSGRFNLMSQETMEHSLVTTRAFGSSMREMADTMTEFEKVGLGAADTLREVDTAGRSTLSLGLNAKKTTEMLKADIGKLNEYGFANGVQGLNRMIQKSLEFKMNMGEVFKIAEKVMSPDSAIELTANLQVLGGAIGDFNDPLKLMYMATNNVEGLQDALIGAAGNLATYNEEQGRFELKGANLRRAQEMAKQLGVDYKEFAKSAIASQERMAANNTLLAKGFDMSDKDREFLTNMSQMKDGHMSITVPESLQKTLGNQTELRLDQLSQNQIDVLKANRKAFEEMNPEDIAKEQFSTVKQIANMMQSSGLKAVKTAKDTTFGKNEIEDSGIIKLEKIAKETLTWTTEFSDKMLKNQETKFTAELKNIMDGLKSFGETYIEKPMKDTSNFLREQLLGSTSADYLKTRKEEQDKKYERSDSRTNEFVIKSQINVVSTGFNNQPIIEKRGVDYITPIKTK
jgi:hypothetical protein